MLVAKCVACSSRGNTMRFVPNSTRESARAKIEHQIDRLKMLISRTAADNGDLQTTGAHLSAALETLNRQGRIEAGSAGVPVPCAEWAALDAATLRAATALQEAMASVDLMRIHAGAVPSRPEFQHLADRLARADAAFRMVAVGVLRARLPQRPSSRRGFLGQDCGSAGC